MAVPYDRRSRAKMQMGIGSDWSSTAAAYFRQSISAAAVMAYLISAELLMADAVSQTLAVPCSAIALSAAQQALAARDKSAYHDDVEMLITFSD